MSAPTPAATPAATLTETVRQRLADGRAIADSHVHFLVAYITRLTAERDAALADVARMREALNVVSGGHIPGGVDIALSGDWRAFVIALQVVASTALASDASVKKE